MSRLVLNNIKKSFGELEVLHGVTLDVAEGEFIALVGPSGCGKSTLLRMIAGLEGISSGEITLGGKCINEVAPKDRDIAMVFQSYALYPHMSVRQNMGFALKMAGQSRAEQDRQVDLAAEILGLEPFLERRPKELSGGQMQRVAMGRAIVRNPSVFLFDEPLSNLDAKLRGKVRGEIKTLHARLGTTTIYVTHDQVEAMTLAHRLVVMRDGYVEQIGTPLALYDHPITPFVAGFIGSPPMNLITGKVSDGTLVTPGGSAFRIPKTLVDLTGEITFGIRPEHMVQDESGWPLKVAMVENMGHDTHISGTCGEQNLIFATTSRDFPDVGNTIHVRPDPDRVHVFKDGIRI